MLKRLDNILRHVFQLEKLHNEEVSRRIEAEKRQLEINKKILNYLESEEYKSVKESLKKSK
jgi:hypothetical protein